MSLATIDDLRASLGTVSNVSNTLLDRAMTAASSWVTGTGDGRTISNVPEVQEAVVLLASRLYKRRQSPEGVAGWGDLGVVRIIANDPDIARLLEHHVDMTNAGVA